jgi:hypothetical protein
VRIESNGRKPGKEHYSDINYENSFLGICGRLIHVPAESLIGMNFDHLTSEKKFRITEKFKIT